MASAKPQGAYEAAQAGVEICRRFFSFKEDIERGLGVPAIWYAEGALMVHPKLLEELRKQPDAEVLEVALTHCFVTKGCPARMEWGVAVVVANELNRHDRGLWYHKVERDIDDKRWIIVRQGRELERHYELCQARDAFGTRVRKL